MGLGKGLIEWEWGGGQGRTVLAEIVELALQEPLDQVISARTRQNLPPRLDRRSASPRQGHVTPLAHFYDIESADGGRGTHWEFIGGPNSALSRWGKTRGREESPTNQSL